jgi:ABC-type Co2+ transport system permease subunit
VVEMTALGDISQIFYVVNFSWIVLTASLIFGVTSEVYSKGKFTVIAWIAGPFTIVLTAVFPVISFFMESRNVHFSVIFYVVFGAVAAFPSVITFLLSRYLNKSGRQGKPPANKSIDDQNPGGPDIFLFL